MRKTYTCASRGATTDCDVLVVQSSLGTPGIWFTSTNDDPTREGRYEVTEVLLSPEDALDLADRIIKEIT